MKKFPISRYIIRLLVLIPAILAFQSGAEAASGRAGHMAVLNFRASGVPPSYAGIIGNYLEIELLKSNKLVLLEREQVRETYRLHELNEYACQDSSCAVFAGKMLAADYVVIGDVQKNGVYAITVKLVSVENETTILTCRETFRTMGRARKATKKIAERIIALMENSSEPVPQVEKKQTGAGTGFTIGIDASLLLFQPLGMLGNLIETGPGFTCGLSFSNMFPRGPAAAQNISIGLDTGFLYSTGRINRNDSFMLVPLLFSLGYQVPLFEKVYFTPLVSGGLGYIRFYHSKGDGFDMEENSQKQSADPLFRVTVLFGRPVTENLYVRVILAFWVLVESPQSPYFLTVHAGVDYHFKIQ